MAKSNPNKQLIIILASIVGVFIAARCIAFLMLEVRLLPMWFSPSIGSFRLHHFVYGNIIILITSFLAIALQAKINKNILAAMYGIGLGLVLDEFPLWMGYVPELTRNWTFIPMGTVAVTVATLGIMSLLLIKMGLKSARPRK